MAIRKSGSGNGTTNTSALTSTQKTELANATTLTEQFDVDENLNTISTSSTLITGTNSVGLGSDHTISAGGNALALKIGDTKYFIPAQELAQGAGIKYLNISADEASKDIQGTHTTQVDVQDSTGIYYTESYTVSADEIITGITLYPAETGYLKYKLYSGANNPGTVIYEKVVQVTDPTTSITLDASFFLSEDSYIYAEVSGVILYGSAADGEIYTSINYLLASITTITLEGVTYTGTDPITIDEDNVISLEMDASSIVATDANGDTVTLSSSDITGVLVNNNGTIAWEDEPTTSALTLADSSSTASTSLTLSRTSSYVYPTINFINSDSVDYDVQMYAIGTGSSGEGWLLIDAADILAQGRLVVGSASVDTDHTLSVAGTAYIETSLAIGDITLKPISAVNYPLTVAEDGTLSLQVNEDYFETNDSDELDLILSNIDVLELKNASTLSNGTIQGTFGADAVVTDFDDHTVGDWWQCQFDGDDSASESDYITLGDYTIYAGDKLYITTSTEGVTLTSDTFSTYVAYIQNQDNNASDTIYGLVKLSTAIPEVNTEDGSAGTANGLVANENHSHPFTTQPVEHGGTGLTSISSGSILYTSADDTIAALTNSSTANTILANDTGSLDWTDAPTLTSLLATADLTVGTTSLNSSYDFYNAGTTGLSGVTTIGDNTAINGTLTIGSSSTQTSYPLYVTGESYLSGQVLLGDDIIVSKYNGNKIAFTSSNSTIDYSSTVYDYASGNLTLATNDVIEFAHISDTSTGDQDDTAMWMNVESNTLTLNSSTSQSAYSLYNGGTTYLYGALTAASTATIASYTTVGTSTAQTTYPLSVTGNARVTGSLYGGQGTILGSTATSLTFSGTGVEIIGSGTSGRSLILRDGTGSNTNRYNYIGAVPYDESSNYPVYLIGAFCSTSGNALTIGGGSGSMAAATSIGMFCADDLDTRAGTQQVWISTAGMYYNGYNAGSITGSALVGYGSSSISSSQSYTSTDSSATTVKTISIPAGTWLVWANIYGSSVSATSRTFLTSSLNSSSSRQDSTYVETTDTHFNLCPSPLRVSSGSATTVNLVLYSSTTGLTATCSYSIYYMRIA